MNLFITNREIIQSPDGTETIREDGGDHAGDNLRFGSYELATQQFTLFPEPDRQADLSYELLADRNTEGLAGSARFFKTLYDELSQTGTPEKNDALFFIHGFNTNLEDVRSAFSRLHECYVKPASSPVKHLILFTWPGRSPKIPYHYFDDKKDAIRSGEALARGIEKVIRFFKEFLVLGENQPCGRQIHLMVHSMGNRVLKHMLLQLQACGTPIPEMFKEILLMAADIEYDIFDRKEPFYSLIDLGARVHVYYHRGDRVLDISKYTKNFSNRLGRYGRKQEDPTLADVWDANVTRTQDDRDADQLEKKFNHWYYYTSSEVVGDVIRVMVGGDSAFVKKA